MTYEPLDIFCTKGTSWVARMIRWATREPGEPATKVNHVGAIMSTGALQRVECIEAIGRGVTVRRFWTGYAYKKDEVVIYRPVNIPPEEMQAIAEGLLAHEGQAYGYWKLVPHLLRKLTRWKGWLRLFRLDQYTICSYLIAVEFSKKGYKFGVRAKAATPDDILDFCEQNPDKYELVRPLTRVG